MSSPVTEQTYSDFDQEILQAEKVVQEAGLSSFRRLKINYIMITYYCFDNMCRFITLTLSEREEISDIRRPILGSGAI